MLLVSLQLISTLMLPLLVASYNVKIGIISSLEDDPRQNTERFWALPQNTHSLVTLQPVVENIMWWETFQVARAACNLVKSDVNALLFLGPPRLNFVLSSFSNYTGLPLITAFSMKDYVGKYEASLLPDTSIATSRLLSHLKWERFAFIYDDDSGADQLQKILQHMDSIPQIEAFWKASDAEQAARFIQLLPVGPRRIVLETNERLADELPYENLGTTHVILLTPVGTVQMISSKGFFRLMKFSVVDPAEPLLSTLENRLKTLVPSMRPRTNEKELPDSVLLTHDTSRVFYSMFSRIAKEEQRILAPRTVTGCMSFEKVLPDPAVFFSKVSVKGVTGNLIFDGNGQRRGISLNILEQRTNAVLKVGRWTQNSGLELSDEFARQSLIPTVASFKADQPIRVTSYPVWPFLKVNEDSTFEGYIVDLLEEVFAIVGRPYELHIVKDLKYGYYKDGEWHGMVGELVRGEADVAVSSLTKTREREEVIDFSKNFMIIGLSIVMKKPSTEMVIPTFGPFTFLSIWSTEVWMAILLAIAVFSCFCYAISRFVGAPDRVRALESKGTDNLSPCGSLWYTVGSLLFRDVGIYPRNFSHRIWALMWWGFAFFLLMMYISMLTAALIKTRTYITSIHSRKSSQDVLKELLVNGVPAIGTVRSGSTKAFFLDSEIGTYKDYGRYLLENPDVLTSSYAEGIERVRNSNGSYAYIMESASSELAANTPPCDLLVSSGFLVTRPYAFGLRKNSPYREIINHAVISLMETGTLRNLYEKWWHNMSSSCEDPMLNILPKVYSTSLTLHEVSGVFYLLILFALMSIAAAVVEHYVRTKRITME